MKRIKMFVVCVSLLTTLPMVGCLSHSIHYPGKQRVGYGYGGYGNVGYDNGCNPCGVVETGCDVIEYGGNPCGIPSGIPTKFVDCRTSLSNIGNGMFLVSRGILDVTAAPFLAIGNVLATGCRYEVFAHCGEVNYANPCYQTQSIGSPCSPCAASCSSGCEPCANGYTEGIQYNVSNRVTALLPPPPRRSSSVIQASYLEPSAPAAKFVQPR